MNNKPPVAATGGGIAAADTVAQPAFTGMPYESNAALRDGGGAMTLASFYPYRELASDAAGDSAAAGQCLPPGTGARGRGPGLPRAGSPKDAAVFVRGGSGTAGAPAPEGEEQDAARAGRTGRGHDSGGGP